MKFYEMTSNRQSPIPMKDMREWTAGVIVEGGHEYNGQIVIRIGNYGLLPAAKDFYDNINSVYNINVVPVSDVKYVMEF